MAAQLSNEEWAGRIQETAKNLNILTTAGPCPKPGSREFAKTVDHTLLKLDATPAQVDELCAEARKDEFATVCVRVNFVAQCIEALKGSGVDIACVIGFHEGTYELAAKLDETNKAINAGAAELDLVINYPDLIAQKYSTVFAELSAVRAAAPAPTRIKLIIETSQLTDAQIVAACTLAGAADLDFVKTSTGFNGPGATEPHVRLMKACCVALGKGGREMQVKASGGIRSFKDAVTMIQAGASRLGTSGGLKIVQEGREVADGKVVESDGAPSSAY